MDGVDFPAGTPCWVDTWQPDPRAAMQFYGPLLGWSFDEPVSLGDGLEGEYFTARLAGRRVAGIGQGPPSSPAVWSTYVRVGDVDEALGSAEAAGGSRLLGPLNVGSDGRLGLLTDATGVPFGVWEAGARIGAERMGEPGAWAMSSLHSTDLERAQAFYGGLFGWELEPATEAPFRQWRLSGQVVAVATGTDGVSVPAHWSVNFAVRDPDAVVDQAAALGGAVLMAPFDTPGFRNAVIADPQGGVIAVSARTQGRV
jgi:uncharacterized protein